MAHSPEKVAAVVADIYLGMTQDDAAKKHRVSVTSIKTWLKSAPAKKEVRLEHLGGLIEEHLENEIRTLGAIAKHARDKTWLSKQSAGELGTFYGVLADKAHRILAAIERGVERERQRALEAAAVDSEADEPLRPAEGVPGEDAAA